MAIDFKIHAWGFYAHKLINKQAVFLLSEGDLFSFYKYNIYYISENAANPDKRRAVVEGESEKHFIDLDAYSDEQIDAFVDNKNQSESLDRTHGIGPWNICKMKKQLVRAFLAQDTNQIIKISTDLGHYIADLNVPLHTTKNYDGQETNQRGIHAFCESRLPELFAKEYNFVIGQAEYIKDVYKYTWQAIRHAHSCLERLLTEEKAIDKELGAKKYAFEQKGGIVQKVYSCEYAKAYNKRVRNILEGQIRESIKMIASFWYTAWIDAGRPKLTV